MGSGGCFLQRGGRRGGGALCLGGRGEEYISSYPTIKKVGEKIPLILETQHYSYSYRKMGSEEEKNVSLPSFRHFASFLPPTKRRREKGLHTEKEKKRLPPPLLIGGVEGSNNLLLRKEFLRKRGPYLNKGGGKGLFHTFLQGEGGEKKGGNQFLPREGNIFIILVHHRGGGRFPRKVSFARVLPEGIFLLFRKEKGGG